MDTKETIKRAGTAAVTVIAIVGARVAAIGASDIVRIANLIVGA